MQITRICFYLWVLSPVFFMFSGCTAGSDYYGTPDFEKVKKLDAHFHYNTSDPHYLLFADSINFRFISPNVNSGFPVEEQFRIAREIKTDYPDMFFFLGTFEAGNFNNTGFAEETIEMIRESMEAGASGIKVWKNIGMDIRNPEGEYVMIDDPVFAPVFDYLREGRIPLLGHLGEPRNCWLPLDEMTVGNDRRYFSSNPQYHMYLHPDAPSYEDQLNSRDNVLQLYPGLRFSGAHLASLEWSVEELGKWFDAYPDAYVDLSARLIHLQHQSLEDHEKVRDFLIRYQDRIKYGSDAGVRENDADYQRVTRSLYRRWFDDWVYLATDSVVVVNDLGGKEVRGLQLPRKVVDKIYRENAERFFSIKYNH